MDLLHWSIRPVDTVESVDQEPGESAIHHKPHGFWVSVGDGEDGWREWCESSDFGIARLAECHRVTLVEGANILRISSAHELLDFTRCFEAMREWQKKSSDLDWRGNAIDWREVAKKHDGIIIAPYIWECRLNPRSHWYYSWDVASGCIWNADAIAGIERLCNSKRRAA